MCPVDDAEKGCSSFHASLILPASVDWLYLGLKQQYEELQNFIAW